MSKLVHTVVLKIFFLATKSSSNWGCGFENISCYTEIFASHLDKWKHSLSVLSADDGSIATLVKSGHGVGHLQSACGLAIDVETGNVIVADTGNDRVQVKIPYFGL